MFYQVKSQGKLRMPPQMRKNNPFRQIVVTTEQPRFRLRIPVPPERLSYPNTAYSRDSNYFSHEGVKRPRCTGRPFRACPGIQGIMGVDGGRNEYTGDRTPQSLPPRHPRQMRKEADSSPLVKAPTRLTSNPIDGQVPIPPLPVLPPPRETVRKSRPADRLVHSEIASRRVPTRRSP